MSRAGALLLAVLSFLLAEEAMAQPSGGVVDRANADYEARRYRQVIDLLQPLLYPRSQLASEDEEVTAYTLLGKSFWWLGQLEKPGAERGRLYGESAKQFGALLSLRPRTKLSALTHPKELLDFFDQVRTKLTAKTSPLKALETELEHCRKGLAAEQSSFSAYRRSCKTTMVETRTIRRNYFFWNFVPFGAGQFQNGHTLKGGLFAAGQGAMLLMNIAAFVTGETDWVRNGENRTVRRDLASRSRAKDIQRVQIASGALFWSMFTWSIIDAIVYYRRSTETRIRKKVPIIEPKVELMPEVGRDHLMLGLTARF
ncbi:MAG: hypothetical protein RBU30_11000 [Polyangia bacterium]|jgi:hypothetical protein|nr:hypothetical protein [Polyangia bacterium]